MEYGLKISKKGKSILSTDINDYTFWSSKNSLKILTQGVYSSTVNGNVSTTIPHGLNFTPTYLFFFQMGTSGLWYPPYTIEDQSGKNGQVTGWVDSSNLNLSLNADSSIIMTVSYFIFGDPAQ